MGDATSLRFGPLGERTIHLCIDMQNLFAEDTPWHTPWMERVLPVVAAIARHQPGRTIFTRYIPPYAADARGTWRHYFDRWRDLARDRIDPRLLELVSPLAAMVPPAALLDKS